MSRISCLFSGEKSTSLLAIFNNCPIFFLREPKLFQAWVYSILFWYLVPVWCFFGGSEVKGGFNPMFHEYDSTKAFLYSISNCWNKKSIVYITKQKSTLPEPFEWSKVFYWKSWQVYKYVISSSFKFYMCFTILAYI